MLPLQKVVLVLLATSALSYYQLPLQGGVLEKQYLATIYLGTPPQPATVQIDSGSANLAVNCVGCPNCLNHANPPFDPSLSSTYSP